MRQAVVLLLLAGAPRAMPAEVKNLSAFGRLPALSEGRVMPLDSFARHTLLQLSGKSTYHNRPAVDWLARTMFTPAGAGDDEIFLINNPEVAEAIQLPPAAGRKRYGFAQLEPSLPALERLARAAWKLKEDDRTPVEKELVGLYNNAVLYHDLRTCLDALRRSPELAVTDEGLRKDLGLEPGAAPWSPLEVLARRDELERLAQPFRDLPAEQWTGYQKDLSRLAVTLGLHMRGARAAGPALLPRPGTGGEAWVTIPEALPLAQNQPEALADLQAFADLAAAFAAGEQVPFDLAAHALASSLTARITNRGTGDRLAFEVWYNRAQLFYTAEWLYGIAFLLALASVVVRKRWLYVAAVALVALALLPHTAGILARMKIMERPPVTNLFSTFVFVGWAGALLGLGVEAVQRSRLGLLTSCVSGLALLLVSGRFESEGDTMGVMVAVLDSNFWLATHVVCISLGYAGCCVAGLLGHVHLLQRMWLPASDSRLRESDEMVHGTLAFGLMFSFFGTMLGGIWADQSWGRFWGWDPKENGALVIVLWSAILFHARLCRMIGPRGFAAGSVIGVIWVLGAWLGVNLLGVGLHSYGFTSGIALGFMIACGIEAVFVAVLVPLTLLKEAAARSAAEP
ncbi:MAG: cytochrome c biogenesis protein CcsA [Kiritimatiellia bacterium]